MPALIEGEFNVYDEMSAANFTKAEINRALVCTREFRDTLTDEKLEALLNPRPGGIVEVSPDFMIIEREA